jgi:carbonic anhydrase
VNNVPYELLDFTFHHPAEHTINGRLFDMELQLSHQNASGQQLIVSVLFLKGNPNAALAPLWANMPPPPYSWRDVRGFDLAQLLPKENGIFIYNGSLSMPPCNEGILWVVFGAPLEISPAQLSAYNALFANQNARPLQALNGRIVQWGTAGY